MKNAFIIIGVIVLLMQFIQTDKTNPTVDSSLEIKAPAHIKSSLRSACYDCHSNETKWPWYSYVAPFSWSIKGHVSDGKKWVNFSEWENYSNQEKHKKMKEIYRAVYAAMPIGSYVSFHSEADLSKEQRSAIRKWAKEIVEKK